MPYSTEHRPASWIHKREQSNPNWLCCPRCNRAWGIQHWGSSLTFTGIPVPWLCNKAPHLQTGVPNSHQILQSAMRWDLFSTCWRTEIKKRLVELRQYTIECTCWGRQLSLVGQRRSDDGSTSPANSQLTHTNTRALMKNSLTNLLFLVLQWTIFLWLHLLNYTASDLPGLANFVTILIYYY